MDRMKSDTGNQPLRLLRGDAPDGDDSDAILLKSVRSGNARSAAAFHDRILPVVSRTISRLLGHRDPDYDDVTQQALIELVLTVDRFLGQCPLDAWTSIVSARVVYRHLRRAKSNGGCSCFKVLNLLIIRHVFRLINPCCE